MIKYVPIPEYTDKMWYESYLLVYNKDLAYHMGIEPKIIVNPPTLVEFYEHITQAVEKGVFYGYAVLKDDDHIGHITLDNKIGEWEVGGVLKDPKLWGSGVGVRAVLHAMKWVFEEQERDWVIAFTFGKDPKVRKMLIRGGFKPFSNFLVMDKETWQERWARRVK